MGILLGLTAALGWGIADFLVRYATHRIGTYRTLFFMQFIGLAALTIYLLATGELLYLLTHRGWQPWGWVILVSILNIGASLALYRAYSIGVMMIVAPITSSYAAIMVVLSLFAGEKISTLHAIGMGLALAGVVLTALAFPAAKEAALREGVGRRLSRGVGYAILAAVGYGVCFWIMGYFITPQLGGIVPPWVSRVTTPVVLAACVPLVNLRLTWPRGRTIWFLLLSIGTFDTIAFVAYTSGLAGSGGVAIVSVLSSLYGAVTVLLAWIFLRERLQWSQWLGIVIVFIGVALINL